MQESRWIGVICGLIVVGYVAVSVAQARTSVRDTPAKESVCDGLKADGVTDGLYGLCVAYCEAKDCDLDGIEDLRGAKACERILENYNWLKLPGDPGLPCRTQCPCAGRTVDQVAWSADFTTAVCVTNFVGVILGQDQPFGLIGLDVLDDTCSVQDRIFEVTPEQAEACEASLRQIAANDGVNCN